MLNVSMGQKHFNFVLLAAVLTRMTAFRSIPVSFISSSHLALSSRQHSAKAASKIAYCSFVKRVIVRLRFTTLPFPSSVSVKQNQNELPQISLPSVTILCVGWVCRLLPRNEELTLARGETIPLFICCFLKANEREN